MVRGCLSEITHFPQSYISETGLLVTTAKPSCSHSGHDGFSVFIYQQGKNNHHGYQTHRQLQQTPRPAGVFLCNAPRHLIELRQVSYITCLSASSVQGVCIDSASPLQAASRSPQSTVSSSSLTTPSRSILSLASASRCITLARSLAG